MYIYNKKFNFNDGVLFYETLTNNKNSKDDYMNNVISQILKKIQKDKIHWLCDFLLNFQYDIIINNADQKHCDSILIKFIIWKQKFIHQFNSINYNIINNIRKI